MSGTGVSVVVPVYNSARTLGELVNRLDAALSPYPGSELILVDDGSSDTSRDVIRRLARENRRIRPVFLMQNFGQHNALLAGIREARCPVTVTLDDDLQNPPEEIPKLVAALNEGNDVVYGTPTEVRHGLFRVVASKMIRLSLRAAGVRRAATVSPFRAFRTDIRRSFEHYSAPFVSIDVLLAWGAARYGAVRVRHDARSDGPSRYGFSKLASHALNMMTGFSSWPLRFASIVGFALTVFGICILTYVITRYLIAGGSVPGFPFLASIIAIFSGAQLFALGIIGEYLGKVHFRTMNRPPYVVERDGADDA